MKLNIIQGFIFLLFILEMFSCQPNPYSQGKALYDVKCANCHGYEGKGLDRLIPPLAGTDYWTLNGDALPCMIKVGVQEPVIVNGVIYDLQSMPANPELSDIDIINIINYMHSKWGKKDFYLTPADGEALLKSCK